MRPNHEIEGTHHGTRVLLTIGLLIAVLAASVSPSLAQDSDSLGPSNAQASVRRREFNYAQNARRNRRTHKHR